MHGEGRQRVRQGGKVMSELAGWANYFRHGVSKAVFYAIDYFAWSRLMRWTRAKYAGRTGLSMKELRRRFCDKGWRFAHNGVVFAGASSVAVTRYRHRGSMIRRTRQDNLVRGTRLVIGADAVGWVEDRGERDHGKTDEVGAAEVGGRSGQVTAGEVGPGQYRACHLRTRPGNPAGNHSAGENGPGQGGRGGPGHEGGEVAAGEVRACAVGPRQLQAAQVQPREDRFSRLAPSRTQPLRDLTSRKSHRDRL